MTVDNQISACYFVSNACGGFTMSTKENVLRLLMEQRESLSGERIARRLGVSRNSVWKAIDRLRQDGYQIEAATNRGYLLTAAAFSCRR